MKLSIWKQDEKPLVFEVGASREVILEIFHSLVFRDRKRSMWDFKFFFSKVNYASASIGEDHVFIRRSFITPPIFIHFANYSAEKTILSFKPSYFSFFKLMLWGFLLILLFGLFEIVTANNLSGMPPS
jgi:hypothetical protein